MRAVTVSHTLNSDGGPGPFSGFLGFRIISADADGAVMEADPEPVHCNGGGILHGGYLSSLLDSVGGWAAHAALAPGTPAPHVGLTVQYLRAGIPGERLTATARATSAGRRIVTTEAEVHQSGRLLARAVATHAVVG